jgi:hypothetical protein
MNAVQYVLAFVFFASYAYALGEFVGTRGRWVALAAALASGGGFAALTDPWEEGVVLVALALAAMGVFVAVVWTLWALAAWRDARQVRASRRPVSSHFPRVANFHDAKPSTAPAARPVRLLARRAHR